MIGKIVLAVLLSFAIFLTAGCAFFAGPAEPDQGSSSPGETDGAVPDDSGSAGSCADGSREDLPHPALPGDPLAYFGQTMDQIGETLGEPSDQGLFEGAEYFSYSDMGIALFFWAKPEEDTLVRSIDLASGAELAGIKVGMTFSEIKAVLGAPLIEGYSEYDEAYSLVCSYNQFRLFFVADTADGPTTSVRVKYIIDT